MKKALLTALAITLFSFPGLIVAADELIGNWKGPWYRGMTSGMMTLVIPANGESVVQFTNLDNFGEQAVPIVRLDSEKTELKFSAAGEGADSFVASSRLVTGGTVLEGKGEYDGFPIKFKLKRK